MRRTVRTAVAGTALLSLLGLAACGDDDEATGNGSEEPTGEPIVLGQIGDMDGIHAEYQPALQAWADVVNGNGGIGGRPVRIEVADDEDDAVIHIDLVQEMVEKDGVVAFVASPAESTVGASVDYLETREVAVVGGALGNAAWGTSPILFPPGFQENERARVITQTAATTGKTKLTFLWPGDEFPPAPGQQRVYQQLTTAAEEAGIEFVPLEEQYRAGNPDYQAVCVAARDAGVEMMTLAAEYDVLAELSGTCAGLGYEPTYVATGTLSTPEFLETVGENAAGVVGPSRSQWTEETGPADVQVYREAMAANDLEVGPNTMDAWTSGRILEEALNSIDGEITPAAIAEALRGLDGEDLDGMVAPLEFGSSPTEPNPGASCFWVLVGRDGEFEQSEEGQVCLP